MTFGLRLLGGRWLLYVEDFSMGVPALFDIETGRTMDFDTEAYFDPSNIAISPDGRWLALASQGPGPGAVTLIDLTTDERFELEFSGQSQAVAFVEAG